MGVTEMSEEKQFSRRDFLKTTGAATGGIIGGSLLGGFIGFNLNDDQSEQAEQNKTDGHSDGHESSGGGLSDKTRVFFMTDEDFIVVEEAMERIFPESKVGPGAKELGAAYYLDGQLAGQWGSNTKEYMVGPFHEGLPTQGYQSPLTRAEYFTIGINKLKSEAQDRHDKGFHELDEKDMDAILQDFQDGKVDLGVPKNIATSAYFFTMLRGATLEGVYSDPVYRGNRDMGGWKMKQFPGHQHSYLQLIESDEFQEIDPMPNFGM